MFDEEVTPLVLTEEERIEIVRKRMQDRIDVDELGFNLPPHMSSNSGDAGMEARQRLEFLAKRAGVPLTREILEAPDPDLAIMNKVHCYVREPQHKSKPIAMFTDDPLEPVTSLSPGQLKTLYEGLHRGDKKKIPLHKWWLSHPERREEDYA